MKLQLKIIGTRTSLWLVGTFGIRWITHPLFDCQLLLLRVIMQTGVMKKISTNLFWVFSAALVGGAFYVAGTFLWNNAPSTDDPEALASTFFTYIAVSFWAIAVLGLLWVFIKGIFRPDPHVAQAVTAQGGETSASSSRRLLGRSAIVLGLILAITLGTIGLVELQHFLDWRTVTTADPAMAALADQAGMSQKGRLAFLRTHPQLVSDAQMQAACASNTAANNSNGFIEQGCFVPTENRIYIRKMPTDLHNLEISTAAYEMLHPVYLSLHRSSRAAALDGAIEANFTALHDANLNAQVANFAKTEPGARDLELFSLLATGYSNLSTDLAAYYAPYFDNIGATVSANNHVLQLFRADQAQLNQLQVQIKHYDDLANSTYAASVRWANLGNQAKDDYYYNLYKQYISQENTAVGQYNQLLQVYNALATEYDGTQPVQKIQPTQTATQ